MRADSDVKGYQLQGSIESSQDVARVDDAQTFSSLTEPYRRELQVHCSP
jgi:hypothetical protein